MPVQGRTREQLRQSIGYNLGALRTGTAYDAGSTTTLIDTNLIGGDDSYNGKWIIVSDASDSSNIETRLVSDYTASAYRLSLQKALTFSTAAGDTYEIWDEPYRPEVIHDFINQAIIDATGQAYDPVENPDMSVLLTRHFMLMVRCLDLIYLAIYLLSTTSITVAAYLSLAYTTVTQHSMSTLPWWLPRLTVL